VITERFLDWATRRGLSDRLSAGQFSQIQAYLQLLADWNSRLNLTGFSLVADLDAALDRLILEPVLASGYLNGSVGRLVDVGSGSGSPAIPLLIAAPRVVLTMVESRQRKSVFLREAVRAIGLLATVATARLEDLASAGRTEPFDAASIRGVRLDSALGTALGRLLRPGGPVLYFDSSDNQEPHLDNFGNDPPEAFESLPGFRLSILRRL
jgi:16S rRNA (guanine527-N7)-methyltransferase